MKSSIYCLIVLAGTAALAVAQTPIASEFLTAHPAAGQSLPSYVLYHHFLGWVNSIGNSGTDANVGNTRALRNALPARIDLSDKDLQFLRSEAHSLIPDLQARDKKAAAIVSEYRKNASLALERGQPLPSVPPELVRLQQERTAVLVQHYVRMQTSMGREAKSQLDHYLKNEFAPHVSISSIVNHRPANNSSMRSADEQPGQFE
jgi:hypothetical protein